MNLCSKSKCCKFVAALVKLADDQRRTIEVQISMINMLQMAQPTLPDKVQVKVDRPALN